MQVKKKRTSQDAFFNIFVQNRELILRMRLPLRWLRWIFLFAGTWSAIMGYPKVFELINQLLTIAK